MTIFIKTLIIFCLMFLCVIVVVFFISRNILLDDFHDLENSATRENTKLALSMVQANMDYLDRITASQAGRDDTYEFIADVNANTRYINSSLSNGTFTTLKLNFMIFTDSSGNIVFDKAFDLQSEKEIDVPESLYEQISTSDTLINNTVKESSSSGVLILPEGPLLVSSMPVLTGENEDQVGGTLIMGRYLDTPLIQEIEEQSDTSIVIYRLNDSEIPADFQKASLSLPGNENFYLQTLDKDSVAGYTLIQDISGDSGFILRIDIPRDIYNEGQSTVNNLILLLLGLGVVCVGIVSLVLRKTVLSRVSKISGAVNRIRMNNDLSARVSMSGRDELSTLAGNINDMLAALQNSRKKLKAREERFRSLIENGFDVVMIVKADDNIQYVSPSIERILGYKPEECNNRKIYDFIHPDDRQKLVNICVEGLHIKSFNKALELRLRHSDESWHNIETVCINLLSQPAIEGVVINFHDVTERKQAEAILKESEEKLRLIFESVQEGIVVFGLDGKIVDVNNGLLQMHGYSNKEELIGLQGSILISERDFSRAKKGIQNISESGIIIQCSFVKKDGSEFPAMVSTTVIRDSAGRPSGAVSIITDITDQQKTQQQLMLADRLASVGQLAAGIAHELNNPLTSVIGFSELLLERELPADIREDLEVIDREAKRAATVIWGLLTFVRSKGTGKTAVNVNTVIQEVLRLRSYEQGVNNIEIDERLYPELPPVTGNGAQLQQVFMNIIINAEQAMLEAQGKGRLEVTTDKAGNMVRITIKDDGPGISPENIEKIFTPFFTTKEVGKGTGLGLSICHGIITEHGGIIYTRSEQGKGTSFIIELPITINGGDLDE